MSEPTKKKVKPSLQPEERKRIFDETYNGSPSFDIEDEFFRKDSNQLAEENNPYTYYVLELEIAEARAAEAKERAAEAKERADWAKVERAEVKFFSRAGDSLFGLPFLKKVCNGLGPLLFDFVDNDELTDEQKVEISTTIIQTILQSESESDLEKCKVLLEVLNLTQFVKQTIFIPQHINGVPCTPSSMNAQIQLTADGKEKENCFVYPFPFAITTHFPVFFCHPVFADFMDILHERNPNSQAVIEYNKFMEDEHVSVKALDECLAGLIVAVLDEKTTTKNEKEFVQQICSALSRIFPSSAVQTNIKIESNQDIHQQIKMDLAILIGKFPFIIFEAKRNSYSINAALQGFKYYGLTTAAELIDNDPAFLITLDKGIFYLYGMAKVNSRVVCSCLLNLEFTNYHFNIEGFTGTLYRCLSGLCFLYHQFTERINRGKKGDLQHEKYLKIRTAPPGSKTALPFPAIFSVKSTDEQASRIDILSFEKIIRKTFDGYVYHYSYFKPCVYLVKISDKSSAVLKIAYNYGVETHKKLSHLQLAPKVIGCESINDQYHVILMEYLDNAFYDSVYSHLLGDKTKSLNREIIITSLKGILAELQESGLVHGDFRSSNIIAKRSESDPTILEDFKLIDFELSGKVDEPYPFLALKNRDINWHDGVNSFAPRKFEHDKHLFDEMCNNELN